MNQLFLTATFYFIYNFTPSEKGGWYSHTRDVDHAEGEVVRGDQHAEVQPVVVWVIHRQLHAAVSPLLHLGGETRNILQGCRYQLPVIF